MTNKDTDATTDMGAVRTNLNAMLGGEPESEPMEEEVVTETQEEPGSEPEIDSKPEKTAKKFKAAKEKEIDKETEKEPEKKEAEKTVSVHALHEERERRKQLQKDLLEERARQDRAEERQNKILEMLTKPQVQEVYIDPLERVESKLNEVVGTVNKTIEQQETERKTQKEFADFSRKVTTHEQSFVKDNKDYYEAVNFLKANEGRSLAMMGYNPEQIEQEINNQAIFIAKKALEADKSPAEVIYEMAKLRGYVTKQPEIKKTVEDIDKGLKASKSLGNTGGKSDNDLTLENISATELAELPEEEFNALFVKIERQEKRK